MGETIQWDDFASLDVPVIFDAAGLSLPVSDIPKLVQRVKQYLKVNHISNYVFASQVLNVTGCFFSTMLSSKEDEKWESITKKRQVCYARMQYWMDHRATYGNNPKSSSDGNGKRGVMSEPNEEVTKRPRTLQESLNNTASIDYANSNMDLETESATKIIANEININGNGSGDFFVESDVMETFSNVEVRKDKYLISLPQSIGILI